MYAVKRRSLPAQVALMTPDAVRDVRTSLMFLLASAVPMKLTQTVLLLCRFQPGRLHLGDEASQAFDTGRG